MWQAEFKSYLTQVERETVNSLKKIELALRRSGMEFDKKIRKYIINCVDKRLEGAFYEHDIDQMLNCSSDDSSPKNVDKEHQEISQEGDMNVSRNKNLTNRVNKKKMVKRLQKTKIGIQRGTFKGRDQKRFKPERRMYQREPKPVSSTDQTTESEHTQVAVVSSSSFSPKKRTLKPDPNSDAVSKSIKLAKSDLATGLDQKVHPPTHPCKLAFCCYYCSSTKGAENPQYDRIEEVFVHWLVQHRGMSQTEPFEFCVVENVACYFCDMTGSYQLMLEHQKATHPNESIVIVSEGDRKKCALCPYFGDGLIGHFEIEHELLLQLDDFNPLGLNDETLNGLLKMNVQKRYCELCFNFFDTVADAIKHHSVEHPQVDIEHDTVNDNEVKYLICSCQSTINHTEYYGHIQDHFRSFECTQCKFQATNLIDLVEHDKNIHQTSTLKFRCMELSDELMKYYFSTKIVFENGLVLIMHNVLRTKFDNSNRFNKVIEEVLGTKVDEPKDNCPEETKSNREKSMETEKMVKSGKSMARARPKVVIPSKTKLELRLQNRFINDLSIQGVPVIEGEELDVIFLTICDKIGVKVVPKDIVFINRIARLGIIHVRLEALSKKLQILDKKSKKNLKAAHVIDLPPNIKSTQIYINPYMTKYFCNLCKIAKEAKNKRQLHWYILSMNGVHIRRYQGDKGKNILTEDELFKYIGHPKKNRRNK